MSVEGWKVTEVAAIPIISDLFKGDLQANNIGLKDGQLTPCPASGNCVGSQETDRIHAIKPITYQKEPEKAKETLVKVLGVVPRTKIITVKDNYILAESTGRIFGFVDDLEFYFPPSDEKIIQIRSASRVGKADLGVNRTRLEQIRLALKDLGI